MGLHKSFRDPIGSICNRRTQQKLKIIAIASSTGIAGNRISEVQLLQELIEKIVEERHAAVRSVFG